jgi:hypothetical protein
MAILFAAGALAAGILGQYLLFDTSVRDIVSSVEITRSLSRNPLRRGTMLQVTATVTAKGLPRMDVQVTDLPPVHTLPAGGTTIVTLRPDPSSQVYQLIYQIIPDIHGEQPFSGISVTVRNLFFEDTLLLCRERDQAPVLVVQPSGFFEAPPSDQSQGDLDSRRMSLWSGLDFHSLAEYHPGDDIRRVDWKVSAKHSRMFIKRYSGQMNFPPLLVVDLPWAGVPFPTKEFNRLISEVTGRVKHTVDTYQYVSVLVISGPNILHFIREEKNFSRCISELRDWMHPAERTGHFYHMKDRADLRLYIRNCEFARDQTADPKMQAFYGIMSDHVLSTLQYQRTPAFSGQVARTLSQIQFNEADILSLGRGDTSHIRLLGRLLQARNVRVNIRIMEPTDAQEASR